MLTIIVAFDEKKTIGNSKTLSIPWHIKEDLQLFKKLTSHNIVVMGAKTWNSLPKKPLPNRLNIVITRELEKEENGAFFVNSLEKAIEIAKEKLPKREIFVIGGAEIYRLALEKGLVDRMMISKVRGEYPGDIYFPSTKDWYWRWIDSYNDFILYEYRKMSTFDPELLDGRVLGVD